MVGPQGDGGAPEGPTRIMEPAGGEPGWGERLRDLFGGPWVWLVVALIVVAALVVRFTMQPARSTTQGSTSPVSAVTTTAVPATTIAATTTAPTSTTTTVPPSTEPPPTTELPPSGVWVMPDVVDTGLQSAKRAVRDASDGAVTSVRLVDASGQGRNPIVHDNWKVCTQDPSAGAKFTVESGVELGVVKQGETCPGDRDVTGAVGR